MLGQNTSASARNNIRVTQHAQQEMTEEQVSLDEVLEVVLTRASLWNYPQHRREACCYGMVLALRGRGEPYMSCGTDGSTHSPS